MMKKVAIFLAVVAAIYLFGVLSAEQVVLFNYTDKPVEFSFKFFHEQAKKKMVIPDFVLKPKEKTCFPQLKDMHLARPLKVKVKWVGDEASEISKKFDPTKDSVRELKLIQKGQVLSFSDES